MQENSQSITYARMSGPFVALVDAKNHQQLNNEQIEAKVLINPDPVVAFSLMDKKSDGHDQGQGRHATAGHRDQSKGLLVVHGPVI